MTHQPTISVLMSVYNQAAFVMEALSSILDQDFVDFELLVVDDGSTDDTVEILIDTQSNDDRLQIFTNPTNIGLTRSLNFALTKASGQFIARMDADDICFPDRFSKQVYEFENNSDLMICGSNAVFLDETSSVEYPSNLPVTDQEIRCFFLLGNPFVHSSVMLRLDRLRQSGLKYDLSYRTAQDYELWSRVINYGSCKNIKTELITCRKHHNSISHLDKVQQITDQIRVRNTFISRLPKDNNTKATLYEAGKNTNLNSDIYTDEKQAAECHLRTAISLYLTNPALSSDYNMTHILGQYVKATVTTPKQLLNITRLVWPLISFRSLRLLMIHTTTRVLHSFRIGGFAAIRLSIFS